jgi:hypothetical protein
MIKTLKFTFLFVLLFSILPMSQAAFRVKASVQAVSSAQNTNVMQSQSLNTGSTLNTNASGTTATRQSGFSRFTSRVGSAFRSKVASVFHLPYNDRRGGDNGLAIASFICGAAGVGLFSLAVGAALGSGGLLACVIGIIVLGSVAFWAGLAVIQEGRDGIGWAIAAMVLGCITILPPLTWLCLLGGGYSGGHHHYHGGHRGGGNRGGNGGPRSGPHRTSSHEGR